MSKNLKEVVLPVSGYKVFLKTSFTYGENRDIQATVFKNMKTKMDPSAVDTGGIVPDFAGQDFHDFTFKRLMIAISRIEGNDGKSISFDESFINDLSLEDGQKIEQEVAKIFDESKKK